MIRLKVIAPVRCPDCRSRLTATKWLRNLGLAPLGVRWCKRCLRTVAYDDRVDGWRVVGALREDGDA
jgi:hypothetical protein